MRAAAASWASSASSGAGGGAAGDRGRRGSMAWRCRVMSGTSICAAGDRQVVAGLGHPPALLHPRRDPLVDLGQPIVQRSLAGSLAGPGELPLRLLRPRARSPATARAADRRRCAARPGSRGTATATRAAQAAAPTPAAATTGSPTTMPTDTPTPASRMPPGRGDGPGHRRGEEPVAERAPGHRQKLLTTAVKTLVMLFGSLAS